MFVKTIDNIRESNMKKIKNKYTNIVYFSANKVLVTQEKLWCPLLCFECGVRILQSK